MEVIRKNIFETNSSASHTVSIDNSDMFDFSLDTHEIKCNYFSDDYERYYSIYDKLSYIFTYIFQEACCENDVLRNNESASMYFKVKDIVKECTGKDIVVKRYKEVEGYDEWGYIEHPTAIKALLDASPERIKQFIFNPKSYLETDDRDEKYRRENYFW